jgi:tetratricopeptide (TPR) repeat protein
LAQATQLHQSGELERAKSLYESLLAEQPDHADALHLLGVIALQTQQAPRAIELMDRAIAMAPARADFLCNRGLTWQALGQHARALQDFEKAVAMDPSSAAAHYNRGTAQQQLREHTAALQSYEEALALEPDFADAWVNSGVALQELEQWDSALQRYANALQIAPDHANACSNQGVALHALGRYPAALASCSRAVALQPGSAQHHYNLGNVLRELERFEDAVSAYDVSIALQPQYVQALSNRGVALQKLGEIQAAIASYDRAIALDANAAHPHYNRGNALHELQMLDAATQSYDQALRAQADYPEAHWNKSLTLLLGGDFCRGLPLYEWRWHPRNQGTNTPVISTAPWLGQTPIQGKTLLLYTEQGLGDTLQFCRYAPQLAAMGAKVVLEVPKALYRLLQGLDGVDQLVLQGAQRPGFDLHCPLMSLPLALMNRSRDRHAVDPWLGEARGAYLKTDARLQQAWEARLAVAEAALHEPAPRARRPSRVGLVWRGSPTHANDHQRSLALPLLLAHLPLGGNYVSLQKEVPPEEVTALQSHVELLHLGTALTDFALTASLVACLDLVLCVDTAVAHLAGAMGKETWVLLPYVPDWRWQLERGDSPWYPSMRLYRQTRQGDWSGPLQAVRQDLSAIVAGGRT